MNRYIIFLLTFFCCVKTFGQDFGSEGIRKDAGVWTEVPGIESVKTKFNAGQRRESNFYMPKTDDLKKVKCVCDNDAVKIYTEAAFLGEELYITSPSFHARYDCKHENNFLKPTKPNVMKINANLELATKNEDNGWTNTTAKDLVTTTEFEHDEIRNNDNKYNLDFTIREFSYLLKAKETWEYIMGIRSNVDFYNRNGYIDIYFRFVYYTSLNTEDGDFICYTHTPEGQCLRIRIYRCEIGNMNIVDGETPLIDASKNLYALIEGRESPVTTSTEVKISKDSRVCQIINKYTQELSNSVIGGPIETTITPGQFVTLGGGRAGSGGGLTAGDTFNVKLKAVTGAGWCESPSIKFLTLPKPQLKGFSESDTKKIKCPTKSTLTVGMTLSEVFDNIDLCTLEGNKCDLGAYGKYESVYGIEYGWRYWTNKNGYHKPITIADGNYKVTSTKEMLDYEPDGNTPGLQLPTCVLEPGVTYYFEQYVTLKNFGNMGITATAEAGTKTYYEVKLSKSLDDGKLSVDISRKEACMEEDLTDVVFTAKYGDDENPKDYNLENFAFYWNINGESDSVNNELYMARDYPRITEDIHYQVSMNDGCKNTISKEVTLKAHDLPKFDATNIASENPNVSYTVEEDLVSQKEYLLVSTMKGREFKLVISDSVRSKYNYYYRLNDEEAELTPMPLSGYRERNNTANKTIYFYKEAKNGYKCLSKAVKVKIVVLNELVGNEFANHNIYVCPGSKIPAISFGKPEMTGAADFDYEWMYSEDMLNWNPMANANMGGGEDKHFTEQNYPGDWERKIEEGDVIYLKRYVTAKTDDGKPLYVDESDSLVVTTYSSPNPNVMVDDAIAIDPKCYGDTVVLSMNINNENLTKQINQMRDGKSLLAYGYYDFDGNNYKKITDVKNGSDWRMPADRDYVIHSAVNFCGDTIYSKNGIQVKAYDKIELEPSYSKCLYVGNEVTIAAVKDGCDCEIIRGTDTFPSVDGRSEAKIMLASQNDYVFDVVVTNRETGCRTKLHKTLNSSLIREKKTPDGIGQNGTIRGTVLCAGNAITMDGAVVDNDLKDGESVHYSWWVNGTIQTGKNEHDMIYTFPEMGKVYKVERRRDIYNATELCYTVVDTTTVTTMNPLTEPMVQVDNYTVCYGSEVHFGIMPNIGGSESKYYVEVNGVKSPTVSPHTALTYTCSDLTHDTTLSIVVTDSVCVNILYKSGKEVKISVEKNLDFTIVPDNSFIIEDDFKDSVVTIPVTCDGVDKDDVLYYSLNDGAETKLTYNGVSFSVKMNRKDFDAKSSVELKVRRVGSEVETCESEAKFTFLLNEGFDGGAPLLSGNDVKKEIEVCDGSTVKLEVYNADKITFGEKNITKMDDVEWSWYMDNGKVESTTEPNLEIEQPISAVYSVVFSAKDASGKKRKIRSEDFVVKVSKGAKVGRISFSEFADQTFVEYCKNSGATAKMSCPLNDATVEMQWEYSFNGNDWKSVPAEWNYLDKTTGNNLNLQVSKLGNKSAYFRMAVTDKCNAQSYSDNMLLVNVKANVELPIVSLGSSSMYATELEFPDSLVFNRHYRHIEPYEFLGRGEVVNIGGSSQKMSFKDSVALHFGTNHVDVLRSEKARISEEVCMSDTLHYAFKIYQKLGVPELFRSLNDSAFCSSDGKSKYLNLYNISGGDTSSYETVWQYKLENGDWSTMKEGDNRNIFTTTIGEIEKNKIGEHEQEIIIQNLTKTIIVRAAVTCGSNYPGGYVLSNEVKMPVYAPMKDGGIDFSAKEICYNTAIDTIKGFDAQGGSGRYTYLWQKSTDEANYTKMDNMVTNGSTLEIKNNNGNQNLHQTTYFRRIVTDDICKTRDTSEVKTVFVMDSFNIYPENVEYDRIASNKTKASMYGVTDFSGSNTGDMQYVWYKSPTTVHGRSAFSEEVKTETLTVPNGDDSYVATYYVSSLKGRCESANKLELNIYVYNQTGGEIYFGDQESKEDVYWVCSGDESVKVLSDDYAPNATFEWYYAVNGAFGNMKQIKGSRDGKVTTNVTSPDGFSADTTNMVLSPFPLRNNLGTTKSVSIFRLTWFEMEDGKKNFLSSDTITVHIVPTLQSVSEALYDGDKEALAGEIFVDKSNYCLGEMPNAVKGLITPELSDVWSAYGKNFGPWLYGNVPGAFTTHYEYQKDNGEWIKTATYDYGNQAAYAGMEDFMIRTDVLDGSYRVRRVMEDGCSSMNSNNILLNLYNDKIKPDTVVTYAYTPEMTSFNPNNAIKSGYEVGDSIVFRSEDGSGTFLWYLDKECTQVINEDGKPWCGIRLTDEIVAKKSGDGAKIYVKKRRGECDAEPVAIPFEFGMASNGGTIYIMDSIICQNGIYADIIGVAEANGEYISPVHEPMKWTYAWQYKRSTSDIAEWSSISGETSEGLSSEVINGLSTTTLDSPLLIRRVATNDKGRVRYSNVLTLTRYDELKAGSLSVNGKKTKFCTYDELPYVSTTSASGGKVISFYDVTWQYSINNGEWETITCFDSLYVGLMTNDLDRSVNNIVSVRCLYADACDEVESERLDITLYRENPLPRIYEVGDSCGASLVCIKLYDDGIKKTRSWNSYYVDPEDTTYTALHTGFYSILDSIFVLKGKGNATYYTLNTEDWETGCVSDTLVFYVDSMPAISQEKPIAPTAICAGSDLEIIGGAISGGSGDKTYQWQSSQTGNEEDYSDVADATRADFVLQGKFIKAGTYFRRIVRDMCHEHVSDAVFVDVRQKVNVSPEEITFEDFKCPNGTFTAKVDALADSLFASKYWTLGEDTIRVIGKSIQMEGFLGDSMGYRFIHYVTDTAGLTCQSDSIVVYAHNKPSIVADDNVITTENYTPCNDRKVKIEGEKLGGQYSDKIKYAWYVNGGEVIGEFGADLNVTANGDMRIVRVADNGCVKVASDTLHIEGQIVYAYDYESELSMEVVSDVTDSSVVLNIQGSKLFSESYTFDGDGVMPDVSSNNILLPYKFDTYKDSVLNIYAKQSYCVKPYAIHPLRGGVISFDGGTLLCGDEDIPSIVVTELEGVNKEVSYQWQYRNERTPDFININGATNKDYTPEAIDVATTYRRIATAGAYKSISNELTVSIRPLPTVAQADINYTADELREFGLGYKAHEYYQWIPNEEIMRVYLVDSASNADRTYWQKSYDQKEWVMASKEGGDSMLVSDTMPSVYYRYIAESACGADTSDIINLVTMNIDPITDDQVDWEYSDTFTCSNSGKTHLYFTLKAYGGYEYFTARKKGYDYSFRVESNCNVTLKTYIGIDAYIAMYDENGEEHLPTDDVTLYVTRHDTTRGLSVTRAFVLKIDHLNASFSFTVDGVETHQSGGKEASVRINQGSHIVFTPQIQRSDVTYKWQLIEPLNSDYFKEYGGSEGREGLVSNNMSPECYYYNPINYNVKLEVTDGRCKATVVDHSMYIDMATFRALDLTTKFVDSDSKEYQYFKTSELTIYPTPCSDWLHISPSGEHVMLFDTDGHKLYEGMGAVKIIDMRNFASGVYFLSVDEEIFKVLKK